MTISTDTGTAPRVALVTGGSGGIGAAVVERLAADGFAVAVHYAGSRDKAEDVARAARDAGATALVVGADVADEDAVATMFDAVERELGGVDVLVHSAGIMLLSPLAELDLDDFDRMHRTNVRGTFVVAKEAVKRLRSGGAIINFSSTVVKLALPTYAAYAATKGAVDAMTMILAKELRGRDITVNAIAPGPTATPLFLDGKPQEAIDRLAAMPPLERLGVPTDIADAVAFLAGRARWVNGQVLYVNGGIA
ncbi:3-ketoacyl-ACP reductase [Virgisporangium aliadipatigenens]|uniref:3-ketoacyl-ACP reductase n=1 Tax=Virgisporangium aliadipatigenens TaxID=741659 RepID=A0A8J3YLN2_9ACTN|nr:SDR family oxidoreductase [Virgisporangium aliadipatigenens]GIJ46170.1 3-ketoacyl-ACP reductase [Virgisporangium aliadipatigenens]